MRAVYPVVHAFEDMHQHFRRRLGRVETGDPTFRVIAQDRLRFPLADTLVVHRRFVLPVQQMKARPLAPDGAHQLSGAGRVLLLSNTGTAPFTAEYPDSGKFGVSHPDGVFRVADAVDYWDGE